MTRRDAICRDQGRELDANAREDSHMSATHHAAPQPPHDDQLLTLAEAARLLPVPVHPSALWRWATRGVEVDGERVRLRVLRFGRKLMCYRRDVFAFGEALGEAHAARFTDPPAGARRDVNGVHSATKARRSLR
jgi:hypothetical protein